MLHRISRSKALAFPNFLVADRVAAARLFGVEAAIEN